MSAEIPYWWDVTTQIWVVLLIGCTAQVSANQKHDLDLGTDALLVWYFCACFSDVISQGNHWRRHKMLAVFSGYLDTIIW